MLVCIIADIRSTHIIRITQYLASHNNNVHLISLRGKIDLPSNIQVHVLRNFKLPLIRELMWMFQARRLVRQINPDIVDGHYITVYGFIAAFTGFHPLVVTIWGSDVLVNPWVNPIWKFTGKYAMNHADKIACLFPLAIIKEKLYKLNTSLSKVVTYYLGVDTDEFQHFDDRLDARIGFGINASSPVVINTRGLAPVYDIETFMKAIPIVLNNIPETEFIVLYHIGEQNKIQRLKERFQIVNNIKFIEWIPRTKMPKLLSAADVYVSTSLSDGASNGLLEAMACELATVVTDIPANKYWVCDSENGFLFKPGDYKALAEKIIFLIRNKNIRESFGEISREIVRNKAEQKIQMANIQRIYQELVEKHSRK